MTELNDVSHVIQRTALIENILDQVISKHLGARKEAFPFVMGALLDGSVIALSGKFKLVGAIAQEIDFKLGKFPIHEIMSYRNAFAHHGLEAHPTYHVQKDPADDYVDYKLRVMNSNGKIKEVSRDEARQRFDECYEVVKSTLGKLYNAVVENVQPQESQ